MKTKISIIFLFLILLMSCTVGKKASGFQDFRDVGRYGKDSCVLYVVRGSSMYGGAVPWSVIIKRYNQFSGKFENNLQVNGVKQKSYTPVVLQSNALYTITFGPTILMFSGTPNSQSIFKVKGTKNEKEVIRGNALMKSDFQSVFSVHTPIFCPGGHKTSKMLKNILI